MPLIHTPFKWLYLLTGSLPWFDELLLWGILSHIEPITVLMPYTHVWTDIVKSCEVPTWVQDFASIGTNFWYKNTKFQRFLVIYFDHVIFVEPQALTFAIWLLLRKDNKVMISLHIPFYGTNLIFCLQQIIAEVGTVVEARVPKKPRFSQPLQNAEITEGQR